MRLSTASTMRGEPTLPGDKSISHRAAMMSAIAIGETRISNYSASDDCSSTLKCLADLGVSVKNDREDIVVTGVGVTGLSRPSGPLDCGNSGTTMRLLAGILAGQDLDSTLTGDASLNKRPMKRIAEPLAQMGAAISLSHGHAPINIEGRNPLRAINYVTPIASAQIKSAVLLAGLYADGPTSVVEPEATRDHTERMLRHFGIAVTRPETGRHSISIAPGQPRSPGSELTAS